MSALLTEDEAVRAYGVTVRQLDASGAHGFETSQDDHENDCQDVAKAQLARVRSFLEGAAEQAEAMDQNVDARVLRWVIDNVCEPEAKR